MVGRFTAVSRKSISPYAMTTYLVKRLVTSFFVMLGVTIVVFLLFIGLGDPVKLMQGQRADVNTEKAMRAELGLDKPKAMQLLLYINDLSPIAIHQNTLEEKNKYHYISVFGVGNHKMICLKVPYLRRSFQTNQPVTQILLGALPNTLILALAAFILATFFGILFGMLAALWKGKWQSDFIMTTSLLGVSTPSYFAAILLVWVFAWLLGSFTGLNLYGSLYEIDPVKGRYIEWKNLILPAFALGIRPLAIVTQLTRSSMLEVQGMDFMRTATSKGLSKWEVIVKHGLRNALNPVVTAISGWLASLLAGAFFVEFIFGWKGLGKITVDGLMTSDFPVVMGGVLLVSLIFVLINILVDITYTLLDPRVRLS